MKRKIEYKVSDGGRVSPSTRQWGGMQYEDNATEIVFDISDTEVKKEGILWRIDFNSSAAGYNPSETLTVEDGKVKRLLPYDMTRCGGEIQVTLVGTEVGMDGEEQSIAYSVPVTIYLTDVEQDEDSEGKIAESLTAIENSVKTMTERLEDIGEDVSGKYDYLKDIYTEAEIIDRHIDEIKESGKVYVGSGEMPEWANIQIDPEGNVLDADELTQVREAAEAVMVAKAETEEARFALEEGSVFVFQGGDAKSENEVDLVVDGELSEVSENAVQNKAVSLRFKEIEQNGTDREARFEEDVAAVQSIAEDNRKSIETVQSETEDNRKGIEAVREDIDRLAENIHIVESGTSGIWTYRVWSDSTAECWGRMWYQENLTALTPFVVDPNYIYDTNFPYPFIDEPCVTATITNCINIYQMLCDLNYTTQQINSFAVFASASMENAEGLVAVYAKGKVELGGIINVE